jgi:hypothetical protein
VDWNGFTREYLGNLSSRFDKENYPVGHVKVIAENNNQYIAGNLTGKASTLTLRGAITPCDDIRFTVNARVETSPETLNAIVNETLDLFTNNRYDVERLAWRYLTPGRPNPTYRFDAVV